jgi:hypothetical protein
MVSSMQTSCVVATTTWNSIDLVTVFLHHYRRLGFDRVFVMDFDSTDGTRDVLTSAEWRGLVTLVPFPGLARLDSSNILLSVARDTYAPTDWCLFCDPDELLVTPWMVTPSAVVTAAARADSLTIARFNMTAPRSFARQDECPSHVHRLTLRVARRSVRTSEDIHTIALDPPWIFTAIMPKVFVQLGTAIRIGEGDHVAVTSNNTCWSPTDVHLLHYPFRQYSAFRDKVEMARLGFAKNPHLSQQHGWQVRRWVRMADSGTLYDEYLQQFIADEDVERLVDDGTLVRDDAVSRFHSMEGHGAAFTS